MIYHILPQAVYAALDTAQPYRSETLATEGFTHCTGELGLLLWVANRFYRQATGPFVLLCIDETRIASPVRWEESDGNLFPHIYGPLNWDAVERVVDFPRSADGAFVSPAPIGLIGSWS